MNNELEKVIERCEKMCFLLGVNVGTLALFVADESLPLLKRAPLIDLLNRTTNDINDLYYNE